MLPEKCAMTGARQGSNTAHRSSPQSQLTLWGEEEQ